MFSKPRLTAQIRPESPKPLYNPDRGWYEIERIRLTDGAEPPVCQPRHALTLLEINLSAYRDGPLSDAALRQLDALFASLRASGCHAILRPLYDWDGQCFLHEPESLGTILTHIRQMGPLLKAYEDELFLVQGLLVGNWAEMHGSRHLEHGALRELYAALAEAAGPSTYLSVRTPSFWRACVRVREPLLPDATAYRLGVFDDALCSSETDLGTFGEEGAAPGSYTHKRTPDEERAFLLTLAEHAPFGGETAAAYPRNEGNAFVQQMPALAVSYLNATYHPDVVAAWQSDACTLGGVWSGCSCYQAIGERMGYRLIAKSVQLKKDALEIRLLNVGSARLYRDYPVSLILACGESAPTVLPLDTHTKAWASDTLLSCPLPALTTGDHQVLLRIGGIALANDSAFDEFRQANLLGALHVR